MAEPALPGPAAPAAPVAWRPFALMGVVVVAVASGLTLAVVHVAAPGVPRAPDAAATAPATVAPVATRAPAQALPSASAPASAAATTPAASPAGRAPVYVVYEGQTLTELARRFHTTVAGLVALNHITDPDLIYPGQRIRVS